MSTEALQMIAQATGIGATVGQGFVDRSAGEAQAGALRQQAQQATASAAYDETRAVRERRSIIAQQVAAASADGSLDGSSADVIRQNEVNLIADALAIRARGKMQAAGFESRARVADYEAGQAVPGALSSAGARLLETAYQRRMRGRVGI